jgi:3-oxoacyl-[acyl-carrier protein] reductase
MKVNEVRALVTGGAQGMGLCFVEELVAAGAKVAFCDVNAEGVAEVAARTGAVGLVADVSNEADVERLFDEAWSALGSVNVLVNNAGIIRDGLLLKKNRESGEVEAFPKAKWDQVLAVNLTGPFLCMRAFAQRLVAREGGPGVAVNLSSISRAGNMGQGNYSAAKAGLVADTVVWAKELARYDIRVGAVAPGFIATPMVSSMRADALEKVIAPVPLKRLGQPTEIWQAIRFIIECDYFTGRVVEVDGGLVL